MLSRCLRSHLQESRDFGGTQRARHYNFRNKIYFEFTQDFLALATNFQLQCCGLSSLWGAFFRVDPKAVTAGPLFLPCLRSDLYAHVGQGSSFGPLWVASCYFSGIFGEDMVIFQCYPPASSHFINACQTFLQRSLSTGQGRTSRALPPPVL